MTKAQMSAWATAKEDGGWFELKLKNEFSEDDSSPIKTKKVIISKQDDPRIPSHPTRGWMFKELELNGIFLRGVKINDKAMAKMLRDLGYDVVGEGFVRRTDSEPDR